MTYAEKLRDPRWQKRRLEILARDGFSCRSCGSADKELHVHHAIYRRGTEPWEYENSVLMSLCKDCHSEETFVRSELDEALAKISGFQMRLILALAHEMVNYKTSTTGNT